MDYSVIRTGGKQYIVSKDEELLVEKLDAGNAPIEFETLLRVSGDTVEFGEPVLEVSSKGEIVEPEIQGKKVQGIKYKSGGYRKKFGHRQEYTKVKITQI